VGVIANIKNARLLHANEPGVPPWVLRMSFDPAMVRLNRYALQWLSFRSQVSLSQSS